MESNKLNYKFYTIQNDFEESNPLNHQTNNIQFNDNFNSNTIRGTYSNPNPNVYQKNNPFYGMYNKENIENFYSPNTKSNNDLPTNSSTLNERLLSNSIELEYIIFLQIILVIISEIFIGTIGIGWLMSYLIWLNKSNLIGILIYGFFINLMVGMMLGKININDNSNISNQNMSNQNISNQNIFNKITTNRFCLIWVILELSLDKKIAILLYIIGLSCLTSPILYLLNQIDWIICLSLITNLFVGLIYLIKRLGEIKQSDTKELYQNEIPLDMIKSICTITILTGLIELIFNTSLSESSVKTFLLIILTNLILFYIYWCQIKINILNSEEFYYYYANTNIFNCVMSQQIKLTKYVIEFVKKQFAQNN